MKPKELQELIDFIAKSGLNKVDIETEEFKLSVKREPDAPKIQYVAGEAPAAAPQVAPAPAPALPAAPAPAAAPVAPVAAPAPSASESNYITVKAPMIGTLYHTASPDSPPFVTVGDEIKKGQVICIIEAMKLFNEIEAEVSGRVVKILVDNASPVEYDQPLFLVDPA